MNSGCLGVLSGATAESSLGSIGQHPSVASTPPAPPAASHPSELTSIPPLASLLMTAKGNTTCTVIGAGGGPCPLPVKSLRPKNTNPTQDPNTVNKAPLKFLCMTSCFQHHPKSQPHWAAWTIFLRRFKIKLCLQSMDHSSSVYRFISGLLFLVPTLVATATHKSTPSHMSSTISTTEM